MDEKYGHTMPRSELRESIDRVYISLQATLFDRSLFRVCGCYSENYKIRMDLEWLLRARSFLKLKFVNNVSVMMKAIGVSTSKPLLSSWEELQALTTHGISFVKILEVGILRLPYQIVRLGYRSVARS
jgi:hypothetical protein